MKTVLITGASGGIGEAVAIAFYTAGYRLVLHSFSHPERVHLLADQMNAKRSGAALAVQADLRDEKEIDRLFLKASAFGEIGVLINNAGTSLRKLLTDTTASEWDDLFALHVRAPFLLSQKVIPSMVRAREGSIINLSSIWGQVGASFEVAYSAAKGSLIAFTKALAKELAPSNVRVNCIAPGMIDTPMNALLSKEEIQAIREEIPLQRLGDAYEVAKGVLFLASPDAAYITGQILGINGGMVI